MHISRYSEPEEKDKKERIYNEKKQGIQENTGNGG